MSKEYRNIGNFFSKDYGIKGFKIPRFLDSLDKINPKRNIALGGLCILFLASCGFMVYS